MRRRVKRRGISCLISESDVIGVNFVIKYI